MTTTRARFMKALETMPDEALSWLVMAMATKPAMRNAPQIWPDGIGGFQEASRKAIIEARAAADAYLKEMQS